VVKVQRIVIIGCSGSGKSTLARAVGERLGLTVTHLDVLWWQPGWRPHPDPAAFQARARAIASGERWIIDGGFTGGTIEHRLSCADTVLLMDFPRLLCLWRAITRVVQYAGRTRPDLAPGCPEKFDAAFYHYIWTYRRRRLPRIERAIAEHFRGRLVRLRSSREVAAFLAALPAP
jgi:adenylate kinase family enzyme